MTDKPAPPSSNHWLASEATKLLEAKTRADFDALFECIFALDCEFIVNEQTYSREQYKDALLGRRGADPSGSNATVIIQGQTEVEGSGGQISASLTYTVIKDSNIHVLEIPAESITTSSLIVRIEYTEKHCQQDYSLRITSVHQVIAEETLHVYIPQSCLPNISENPGGPIKVDGSSPLNILRPFHQKHHWWWPFCGHCGGHSVRPFGGPFSPGPVRLQPHGEPGTGPGPVIPPPEFGDNPGRFPKDGGLGPEL